MNTLTIGAALEYSKSLHGHVFFPINTSVYIRKSTATYGFIFQQSHPIDYQQSRYLITPFRQFDEEPTGASRCAAIIEDPCWAIIENLATGSW